MRNDETLFNYYEKQKKTAKAIEKQKQLLTFNQ